MVVVQVWLSIVMFLAGGWWVWVCLGVGRVGLLVCGCLCVFLASVGIRVCFLCREFCRWLCGCLSLLCLSVCLSACLSSVCLSACLPVSPLSVCLSACLSLCLSVCLSHLCVAAVLSASVGVALLTPPASSAACQHLLGASRALVAHRLLRVARSSALGRCVSLPADPHTGRVAS